jgi:hypothetical protein
MSDIVSLLTDELQKLVEPLSKAATSDSARSEVFAGVGWELGQLTGFPVTTLTADVAAIAASASALAGSASNPPTTFAQVQALLGQIDSVIRAVRDLSQLAQNPKLQIPPDAVAALATVGDAIVEFLVVEYLSRYHPVAFQVARLLTLVKSPVDDGVITPQIGGSGGRPVMRYPTGPMQPAPARLRDLLADPLGTLRAEYLGGGLATADAARAAASRLFGRLGALLVALGGQVTDGTDTPLAATLDPARTLDFRFVLPVGGVDSAVGGVLQIVSDAEGGAGLVVTPTGWVTEEWDFRGWTAVVTAVGQFGQFVLRRTGPSLPAGRGTFSLQVAFERRSPEGSPATVLGLPVGTRLELGTARVTGSLALAADKQDVGFELVLTRCSAVVAGGDGDGFLAQVLPPGGLAANFDLIVRWSKLSGLHFGGGDGLSVAYPVHASVAGLVSVDLVTAAVALQDGGVQASLAATGSVALGPITAAVDRVGLAATLTFPQGGGNLAALNLAFAFKPPNGVGLKIDAGTVTGGGFLFFDKDRQEYGGVLELEVADRFSVKVIALLSTQGGFSLIGLVFVDGFTPIGIGFGFTLNGVGGMLAINRTAAVDALRAGLKSHRLDHLLFPPDPIANERQIITDLDAVFPRADGRYLFGPMAEIGWGEPTLVTIKLAVLLELPAPVRLIILGQLEALLPDPDEPVVKLHMDAIGVIDFDRGDLALDAVLYDSQLADFALTGAMALRAGWGANRTLVLAIGGLHPHFQPPPGFPTLDRVAIALAASDNPRLRLDAYLAVTSNTVQFGAHLDLHDTAGSFALDGHLGFDTLIHFDPFAFAAELAADLALSYKGSVVMSVALDMTLSGPSPWHAHGKATFHFLIIQASVSFDATFGPAIPPAPVAVPPVEQKLLAALGEPRNWSSVLPASAHPPVRLRPVTPQPQEVLAHPLGQLTVHQREVPLDLAMSRFGTVPLPAPLTFHIDPSSVQVGGQAANPAPVPVSDYFAPGQFRNLTDDERLSRPSFESYPSGLQFGLATHLAAFPTGSDMGYATVVVDPTAPTPHLPTAEAAGPSAPDYVVPDAAFATQVPSGAAARAPLNAIGRAKFAAPRPTVDVAPATFTIAGTDDLKPPGDKAAPGTFSQTADALQQLLAQHPELQGKVQLVAIQEHRRRDLPPLTTLQISPPSAAADHFTWVARATSITLGPAAGVSLRSLSFRVRISDDPPYTTPNATTASVPIPAGEGTYPVDYFGIDTANNEEDRRTVVIALDATPPQSTLVLHPQVPNVGVPATVSAVDSGAGVAFVFYRYYAQGSSSIPGYTKVVGATAGFTISGPDGTYQVDYYATDLVDNPEPARSRLLPLDDTPPQSTLVVGAPGYPVDTPAFVTSASRLTITATDDGSGVQSVSYRVFPRGSTAPPYVTTPGSRVSFVVSGADGVYEVDYYATDHVGNVEAAHVVTLTVDNTPPQSALAVGTPSFPATNPGFVTAATPLTISAADAGAGVGSVSYRAYPQGGTPPAFTAVQGVSATLRLTGADGAYRVDMFATDNLGNAEPAHSAVLMLDGTPPAIAIRQPASSTYASSSTLTLDYSADDGAGAGVASVTATMDGASTLAGHGLASGQAIAVGAELAQGAHTFAVTSVDNLGNSSSASVQFAVGP